MTPRRRRGWWDELLEEPDEGSSSSSAEPAETPIVEWSPIRCPFCGSRRKSQYGQSKYKPVRYHVCLECGGKYRSIESR